MNVPLIVEAIAGLLGLTIGSFLNVVIYRAPRNESILFPHSHCPICQSPIKARHNIPVISWLVLRGRCASCHAAISARYPLVEAGSGALFALIAWHLGVVPQLPAYLFLAGVAVLLVALDIDSRSLPDSIMLPCYVVAALLLMPAGAANSDWPGVVRAAAGVLVCGGVYLMVAVSHPHLLCTEDVMLAGLLGMYLGWASWSSILVGVLVGFLLTSLSGTPMVAGWQPARAAAQSIATPMIAATMIALFATAPIATWYLALVHQA